MELLPRESSDQSSSEYTQLHRYASNFSNRADMHWKQRLRVLFAELGNGYLYRWAARTIGQVSRDRSSVVLDAACGDGMLSRFLSDRYSYVGVDFSSRLLLRGQRYHAATYYRADLNHLPFPDRSFDAAVSLQALQYLDHPETAISQIARVLKPAGAFILSVPNDSSLKYKFQGIPAIQLQRFTRQSLAPLLEPLFDMHSFQSQGFWLPVPRIPVHVPGIYPARWGLSWTILATRKP